MYKLYDSKPLSSGRLKSNRLSFDSWLENALGMEPAPRIEAGKEESKRQEFLRCQVRLALKGITASQRAFVKAFYFDRKTYREISEETGRSVKSLEKAHLAAKKRLKKLLAPAILKAAQVKD
jgi:RNA polymerase sigma factor (sigma-70 family)